MTMLAIWTSKLKAAQNPLPLDKPLDRIWMNIHKIIDIFHFQNHTSSVCKELYNPAIYKSKHPQWNTQAGEQTFIWLGRFKHIVCSMPKHHHLFYIHRMVLRRNAYTAKCYRNGCKPVLPKRLYDLSVNALQTLPLPVCISYIISLRIVSCRYLS